MPSKQFAFVPDWDVLGWMREQEKNGGPSVAAQLRAAQRLYKKAIEEEDARRKKKKNGREN